MPVRYITVQRNGWETANSSFSRTLTKIQAHVSNLNLRWRTWKRNTKCAVLLFTIIFFRLFIYKHIWKRPYNPTMVMMPPFEDFEMGERVKAKESTRTEPEYEPMQEIGIADDLSYKKHNIMLLKIEKCSSTSIQTMLLRFADSHSLSVALPEIMVFQEDIVSEIPVEARTPNDKYNMLVYHTQLDKQVLSNALYDNTVYITMLRDPVDRFISHYMWFRKTDVNIAALGDVGINEYIVNILKPRQEDPGFMAQMNYYLAYFGYFKTHTSLDIPDNCFKEWDEALDLVMITEFFTESLVFLKNLLNWEYDDVVTFEMNKRIKEEGDTELTTEARELLEKWTEGDRRLYTFFKRKFQKRMIDYGTKRLRDDVEDMKSRISYWEKMCISNRGSNLDIGGLRRHRHNWRNDSIVYEVSEQGKEYHFCLASLTTEHHFRKILTKKQSKLVRNSYKFPT